MNLGIVAVGEIFGGAERQVLTLSTALAGRCNVDAFVSYDRELATALRDAGVRVTEVPIEGRAKGSYARRLRELASERAIDCLHLHGYQSVILLGFSGTESSPRIVKTEHGLPELHGRGFAGICKLKLYRKLEVAALRRLDADVVCVTHELRGRILQDAQDLRTTVIHNGVPRIDRGQIQRPAALEQGRINLVAVGRLEVVKGIEFAVAAMASAEMHPEVRLHLVGDGPEFGRLRAQVQQLGLESRVKLIGFSRRPLDYIANAHALLLPSLHEGLPYVVLEAMSVGTPVLAAAVGGVPEVISDGANGLLFGARNVAGIVAAVNKIAADEALRRRLAAGGESTVATRFSAQAMAAQYLELYRRAQPAESARHSE